MYVPKYFSNENLSELKRLMQSHNFATLVTTDPDGNPFATHLPLLLEESEASQPGELVLSSHMARANPQWRHFSNKAEVLAIFHGPNAAIHSNWYSSAPNVPTWNYAVVHVYGRAELVEGIEATRDIAYRLVAKHTPDMRLIPAEYEARLLAAVVTFQMRVSRIEGKYKLSQNKDVADREEVRKALALSASSAERETGELMAACEVRSRHES